MLKIVDCHHCREFRSGLVNGQIYCTADRRTIQDHVAANVCPLARGGATQTTLPAGSPDAPMTPAVLPPPGRCCGE